MPALTVLAHPDADRVGEMGTLPALLAGQSVELSRLKPVFGHPGRPALPPDSAGRQPPAPD